MCTFYDDYDDQEDDVLGMNNQENNDENNESSHDSCDDNNESSHEEENGSVSVYRPTSFTGSGWDCTCYGNCCCTHYTPKSTYDTDCRICGHHVGDHTPR